MTTLRELQPTNAQEIHHRLRSRGDAVGLSTVYRVLHALENDREIRGFGFSLGITYVCVDDRRDSSFEVCDSCGDVRELAESAAPRGTLLHPDHPVHIHGRCTKCTPSVAAQDYP